MDQPLDENGAAAAANAEAESLPPHLKLIADCWEHILDYLALSDILAMSQTCKRMLQMCGRYFCEFFARTCCQVANGNICVLDDAAIAHELPTNFFRFIGTLDLWQGANFPFHAYDFFGLKTVIGFGYARNTIKTAEEIQLQTYGMDGNVFEMIANHCTNMKSLDFTSFAVANAGFTSMFSQRYAALEHLRYWPRQFDVYKRIDELRSFLDDHTKLKCFETKFEVLLANRAALVDTNVQLHVLAAHFPADSFAARLDQFINLLNRLYGRGFYETLCLSFGVARVKIDAERLGNALATVPALQHIHIMDDSIFDVTRLTNLTELRLNRWVKTDVEMAAVSLLRLERLVLLKASAADIQPFIRHSIRLKTIRVRRWRSGNGFDLFAMNQARKLLAFARPVLLYAPERVYLSTKWKSRNLHTDLVKVTRLDAFDLFALRLDEH